MQLGGRAHRSKSRLEEQASGPNGGAAPPHGRGSGGGNLTVDGLVAEGASIELPAGHGNAAAASTE